MMTDRWDWNSDFKRLAEVVWPNDAKAEWGTKGYASVQRRMQLRYEGFDLLNNLKTLEMAARRVREKI